MWDDMEMGDETMSQFSPNMNSTHFLAIAGLCVCAFKHLQYCCVKTLPVKSSSLLSAPCAALNPARVHGSTGRPLPLI